MEIIDALHWRRVVSIGDHTVAVKTTPLDDCADPVNLVFGAMVARMSLDEADHLAAALQDARTHYAQALAVHNASAPAVQA